MRLVCGSRAACVWQGCGTVAGVDDHINLVASVGREKELELRALEVGRVGEVHSIALISPSPADAIQNAQYDRSRSHGRLLTGLSPLLLKYQSTQRTGSDACRKNDVGPDAQTHANRLPSFHSCGLPRGGVQEEKPIEDAAANR